MDGYINLCAAIVQLAIKDYRKALQGKERRTREGTSAKSLERFFRSKWGQTLTFEHGELIIERTKKEVFGNETYI